jgi:hypothetical protein
MYSRRTIQFLRHTLQHLRHAALSACKTLGCITVCVNDGNSARDKQATAHFYEAFCVFNSHTCIDICMHLNYSFCVMGTAFFVPCWLHFSRYMNCSFRAMPHGVDVCECIYGRVYLRENVVNHLLRDTLYKNAHIGVLSVVLATFSLRRARWRQMSHGAIVHCHEPWSQSALYPSATNSTTA